MIIIVYSDTNAGNIGERLGEPEYSYYYVLKAYLPVLKQLGIVVVVTDPKKEVDSIYYNALSHGTECVFLSFSPPHKTEFDLACPIIPVFAWEFDTIPTESWLGKPEHDWRTGLAKAQAAIVHSEFTVASVKNAMGADYPVVSVPAPVWDSCHPFAERNLDFKHAIKKTFITVQGSVIDSRAIDINLFTSELEDENCVNHLVRDKYAAKKHPEVLELDGLIYLTVLNPQDGRKNWLDMLSAFCDTHRNRPDVTLVMKFVHHSIRWVLFEMLRFLYTMMPFSCRIVFIHGHLPNDDYQRLMDAAHFVVNTSHGEGQCLPLMESLSFGKPALAPLHSSMLDYITSENSFIINSHAEPTYWVHDPRRAFRALRHRIDWSSVSAAFEDSYQVFHHDFERYQRMSAAARIAQKNHCSQDVALKGIQSILLQHPKLGHVVREAVAQVTPLIKNIELSGDTLNQKTMDGMDPLSVGLDDVKHSGWYNQQTGELAPDFFIKANDVVLDLGCGPGLSTLFAVNMGAQTTYADIDPVVIKNIQNRLSALDKSQLATGVVTDANPLPLNDSSFTKVIATEVLEHVSDPAKVLAELFRVGQSGALYFIAVPDAKGEYLQQPVADPSYFESPNHVRIFDKETFVKAIEDSGLMVESYYCYGFYFTMLMLFYWTSLENDNDFSLTSAGAPPLVRQWAETWQHFIAKDRSMLLKNQLDKVLPKSQVIIARKP